MNIILCCTSFWNDAAEAASKADGIFGLHAWYKRGQFLFRPIATVIACGTYSDPDLSPLGYKAIIVNSGVETTQSSYDVWYLQYAGCAQTAMTAYVLNRRDWDLLVFLDTDCLVGAVDFKSLLDEFMHRPEVICTNQWCNTPGGSFIAWKRAGARMFLHERRRANIINHRTDPKPMLMENEMAEIYKGVWWNPWPDLETTRQDYPLNPDDPDPFRVLSWPFVRQPHPDVIEKYQATQWPKAVPYAP